MLAERLTKNSCFIKIAVGIIDIWNVGRIKRYELVQRIDKRFSETKFVLGS